MKVFNIYVLVCSIISLSQIQNIHAKCLDSNADNFYSNALVNNSSSFFNDDCSLAQLVICGETVFGNTTNASSGDESLISNCGPAIQGPGVWYMIIGNDEEITAETCGDPNFYDSRIHAFSGTCGSLICEGGNDDFCGLQSSVTWYGSFGVEYYIHVSGWNGGVGEFEISFSCLTASCSPPLNDQCVNALALTDGVLTQGSNVCSYANDTQPSCDPFASINGVWYVWNSDSNNAAVIDFSAATSLAISMFSGDCNSQLELFCNDINQPLTSETIIGLNPATDYYFLIWTDSDFNEGEFELTVIGGLSGCTALGACNFDPNAEIDNDTCDFSCFGCTDLNALNYSDQAIIDDGSCIIPSCSDSTETWTYCYGSDENSIFNFVETTPGNGVILYFNYGTIESGSDELHVYDGLDNTAPELSVQIDGDLSGLVYESSGSSLTIEIITDGSNSCSTGVQDQLDVDIYCGTEVNHWCGICPTETPPVFYLDCMGAINGMDWSCCSTLGCVDQNACNFDECALIDDGSCCYGSCTTITITDTFGDGGGEVTIIDFDGLTVLANLTLDSGYEISEDFCIENGCGTIVVTTDSFPDETGVIITSQNGLEYELVPGGNNTLQTIDLGNTCECSTPGCPDPNSLNYDPNSAEIGGCDCTLDNGVSYDCCIYPIENNECSGAIELLSGVEESWNTSLDNSTGSTSSGYNCSPTLLNDCWFSFTPQCKMEVTIVSTSIQGGEIGVWEGDCEALTEVACSPNYGFIFNELEVILEEGITYFIQTGSNSNFSPTSEGTIVLTEGVCLGCIYPFASNYDPLAQDDDGSCLEGDPSCPGDINHDGIISVTDLTALLALFGSNCPD